MSKNSLFLFLFLASSIYGFAQSSLNDYKYVIVPTQYDFLKGKDVYQLNTLTHFSLNKYGFHAIMEDAIYPDDLSRNNCLALRADVIKGKGMLKTKLTVQLSNCKKEILYTTEEGSSREKSHKVAYNLALRAALKSFESVNYVYAPNETIAGIDNQPKVSNAEKEIAQLKGEIKSLKEEKTSAEPIQQSTPLEADDEDLNTGIIEEPNFNLTAKDVKNGFNLYDAKSNLIYALKKTGMPNVYIVEGKSALVYQVDRQWILEYYNNSERIKEELNITF